jgi:hypothetical protein
MTSAAVVNEEGSMVGNLSVSDIKVIGFDVRYFWLLSQPISEYLKVMRSEVQKVSLLILIN